MTISYAKFFQPTVLSGSNAVLFTIGAPQPASTLLRGGRVRLTNVTASPATATLNAVPSGGSLLTGNEFLSAQSITANNYLDVDLPIMAFGDSLQGLSGTASAINITVIAGSYFS